MVNAKAKDQGHNAQVLNKKTLHKFFTRSLAFSKTKKKMAITLAHFQLIKKWCCPQTRTGYLQELGGIKAKDFKMCS